MTTNAATRPTPTTPRAPQRPPTPPGPPRPFSPVASGASADPAVAVGAATDHPAPRPRGRHRRPRPRKLLFAVGGMALAAGALSLVRLASGPVGGSDAAGPAPRAADDVTDEAANAGATVGSEPSADAGTPTADTLMGGDPTPTRPPSPGATAPTPTPSTFPPAPSIGVDLTSVPGARDVPRTRPAPDSPPATRTPDSLRPAPATPTQHPAAAPEQPATPGDTTTPTRPTKPGLCVPIVGLCVDEALGR